MRKHIQNGSRSDKLKAQLACDSIKREYRIKFKSSHRAPLAKAPFRIRSLKWGLAVTFRDQIGSHLDLSYRALPSNVYKYDRILNSLLPRWINLHSAVFNEQVIYPPFSIYSQPQEIDEKRNKSSDHPWERCASSLHPARPLGKSVSKPQLTQHSALKLRLMLAFSHGWTYEMKE